MTRICRITCLFIVAACLSPTPGADWRQFRGPGGQGISDEKARELTKFIKKTGLKVQAQIQGDQLRVTAKKKDDLQAVIQAVKAEDFGIPLQFTNFRD